MEGKKKQNYIIIEPQTITEQNKKQKDKKKCIWGAKKKKPCIKVALKELSSGILK